MLPELARGDANKVFVVPSEFAHAFAGLGRALAGVPGRRRPKLDATRRAEPLLDALAEQLQGALSEVRGRGTLTEEDVDRTMREIRLALLEADVNFKVVREFTRELREKCIDAEIVGGLNPGQQVVKIVADQLDGADGRKCRRRHLLAARRRP